MHRTTTTALVFILVAMFASSCHARPTRGRWSIKDLLRPESFESDFLDSISLRPARPKRNAKNHTFDRTYKLQSASHWFLAIKDNGDVEGILNSNSPNVLFQLQSVGKGSLVRIYGLKAKKYLAMNSRGKLYTTSRAHRDALFYQDMTRSSFLTFSSATHRNPSNPKLAMYVGLRENGKPKKGTRTRKSHRSALFVAIPAKIPLS